MGCNHKQIWFFTSLVVLLLLCMPIKNVQASAYQNWTGVWTTNRGELRLRQDSGTVSGTYCSSTGLYSRVEGTLTDEWGFTVRGKYYEGIESGLFEFRIEDNQQGFRGWLNSPGDMWAGKRELASGKQVKQQTMTIINNSPHHITAIFVSPANAEDWQEVLAGQELSFGKQRNVVFNLDSGVCTWDIRVVDSSGNFSTFQNLQIKPEFTSINYYYKNSSGQIQFAVG